MKPFLSVCLALATTCVPLASQVVISEINFVPQSAGDDQWIEVQNLASGATDISTWSLYLSTSPSTNYWWGFLPGTVIGAGQVLRVHWLQPVQPTTAKDVYTGNLVLHFLFGLGAEPIPQFGGALGLFNTQSNLKMNDPAIVQDWISWGGNSWKRENLAIQNNRWIANQSVQVSVLKDSIALYESQQAEPTPASAFFHDVSPTPGGPNAVGSDSYSFGTPCSSGALVGATLSYKSAPCSGNRDFGLTMRPTIAGSRLIVFFSPKQGGLSIGGCTIWVDHTTFFPVIIPAANGLTTLDVPLLAVPNGLVTMQAITVPPVTNFTDFGFSNGLTLNIGW
jgi:hypothetical protein